MSRTCTFVALCLCLSLFLVLAGAVPVLAQDEDAAAEDTAGGFKVETNVRARLEKSSNFDFDDKLTDTDTLLLYRTRVGVSWAPAGSRPPARLHLQLQDARVSSNKDENAPYTDRADVRQAWAELSSEDGSLAYSLGRQVLEYGQGRMIHHYDWQNQDRLFEGGKARFQSGSGWLDLFSYRPVVFKPDDPNRASSDRVLWGTYASQPAPWGTTIEPYLIGIDDGIDLTGETGETGGTHIRTAGLHLSGAWGETQEYDGEIAIQRGERGGDTVQAWALYGWWKKTWPELPWSPAFRLEYNGTTGDTDASDGTRETWTQLYPDIWSYSGYGLANVEELAAKVWVKPREGLTLNAMARAVSLVTLQDVLYDDTGEGWLPDPAGTATATPTAKDLGTELSLVAIWEPRDWLYLELGWTSFLPGSWVKSVAGSGATEYSYLYVEITY